MPSNLTPRLASSVQWTELPTEFTDKVKTVFSNQFDTEAGRGEFLVEGRIYPEEIIVRIGYLENGRLKQMNFEASVDVPKGEEGETPNGISNVLSSSLSGQTEGLDFDEDIEAGFQNDRSSAFDDEFDSSLKDDLEFGAEIAEPTQSKTMSLLYSCVDAIGSLMEEYFELGDEEEIEIPESWRAYEFEGETVYLQHSTVNTRLEEEADRILGLSGETLVHEESKSEDALANADIDTELALEIQKAIRSGNYKLNEDPQ